LALSFVVGIIGGTYGIGGGAIIAPFLIAVFGLPVYTVAGAALLGTFLTSIAGVIFYAAIAPFYSHTGLAITPDWLLGAMFGIGGAAGMYVGARIQRFIPARVIKLILVVCMVFIAVRYIAGLFS
ncbi:MAG: sulfite exporter TauE/SafE family protein, partial [Candidatus Zixiibacteriota bacterium]